MEDQIVSDWRKASYSGNGGGNCVEVGSLPEQIAVRDSKDPVGLRLAFAADAWRAFAKKIQAN
jgi:uncharacterized protein DUF397